ncbi:MAG: WD40 repeat domain-containing protein [Pseudomonadota bacterium]
MKISWLKTGVKLMNAVLCGAVMMAGISAPDAMAAEPVTDRELTAVDWIKPKGEPLELNNFGGWINAVAITPDGRQIIADTDKTLHYFDLSLKQSAPPVEGFREIADKAMISPDARRAYVISWSSTITTVKGKKQLAQSGELAATDLATLKKTRLVALKKEVESYAVSADGRRVALGYGDGTFQIVDAATGKSLLGPVKAYKGITIEGNTIANVTAIAFSPDGKRLALGDVNGLLRFFDTATGKALGAPVPGHTSLIETFAFSPDGKYIVSATQDKGMFVLDGATGKLIGDRLDTGNKVTALAFSPDGKRIVTGHFRGDVRLWDFVR